MSSTKSQAEPSMEEILASIRRIISEENEAPRAEARPAEGAPGASGAREGGDEEGDVLQLTRMVQDDGTVVNLADRMAAQQGKAASEPPAQPKTAAPEPGPEPEPANEPGPEPEPVEPPIAKPELELKAPPAQAAAAPEGGAVEEKAPAEESLVSEEATQTSVAALAALAQAVARENVVISGRTLEDITKEILRPLLSEWLNANLPALIERLVRQEIERMVGRVRDR